MVESVAKHLYVPRQAAYKNVETDEKTLTSLSLALEEKELDIQL